MGLSATDLIRFSPLPPAEEERGLVKDGERQEEVGAARVVGEGGGKAK